MTISNWPATIKVVPVETSTVLYLGSWTPTKSIQLSSIILHMLKVGTLGGSETSTIKVYGNADLTAAIATSTAFTMSTVPNVSSARAWHWIKHVFAGEPLAIGRRYHLGLSLANYTRNADTFYVAAALAYPQGRYANAWGRRDDPPANFIVNGES